MSAVSYLLSTIKGGLKSQSALLGKPLGMNLLTKSQTERYLAKGQLDSEAGRAVVLPRVTSPLGDGKILFEEKAIEEGAAFVWRHDNRDRKAVQLRSGNLLMGDKVLNTDFGNNAVFKDLLKWNKRTKHTAKTLIAPWSHYWSGYYDYVYFVASKLGRIKRVISPAEFDEAVLAYPLFNTGFERELLELIGFKAANIVDSRTTNVQFETCLLGNNDSWFYPNSRDVLALKQLIESRVQINEETPQRIYIRRAGRRRVLNEDALVTLLLNYNFRIIDDVPRTVREQIALYRHASFIIGPHGASFANILWCRPGAHLFELFPDNYMPEYFRYLAQVLELQYSGYCPGQPGGSHHTHMEDDVVVSIEEVKRCLDTLLDGQP